MFNLEAPVLAVCPTRGRPENAARLISAWARTSTCSDLLFCVDDDDPALSWYQELRDGIGRHRGAVIWVRGPRQSLCSWTDLIAAGYGGQYQALISIGDDHVPETEGFDQQMLGAAMTGGGGFAYGDDGLQHENLPTCCLVTTNITRKLGRMCLPGAKHMFTDAYWRDLADAAGCRHYLPAVKTWHRHHSSKLSARDQTYTDGEASWAADDRAYRAWLGDPPGTGPIAADAAIVKGALR